LGKLAILKTVYQKSQNPPQLYFSFFCRNTIFTSETLCYRG